MNKQSVNERRYIVAPSQVVIAKGRIHSEGAELGPEHFVDELVVPYEVIGAEMVARGLVTAKEGV
jgi:hypothetical protein